MAILLIDNHDSYTWNLAHLIARVAGEPPVVWRNDHATLPMIADLAPSVIVLSPGPGRPQAGRDLGVIADLLAAWRGPMLGVCLGQQAMAWAEGATIARAPAPMHGRITPLLHDGEGLFRGLAQGTPVVRYHSLAVRGGLPSALRATAWSEDGVLLGLAHRELPWAGVQFHPESVGTPDGGVMIRNFLEDTRGWRGDPWRAPVRPERRRGTASGPSPTPREPAPLRVAARRHAGTVDAERAFIGRFAGRPGAFWLDSSGRQGACPSRFSYLGACDGPLGRLVRWSAGGSVFEERPGVGARALPGSPREVLAPPPLTDDGGDLPFGFRGGWVGYLAHEAGRPPATEPSDLPDLAVGFCDRLVVVDHDLAEAWILVVVPADQDPTPALDAFEASLAPLPPPPPIAPTECGALRPERDRASYLDAIRAAQIAILDGESYEICLTQRLRGPALRDPLSAYRRLRRSNPAPYAAWLEHGPFRVLSSSPEQFLALDRHGYATARPIKGTLPRQADPADDARAAHALATSEKDRAENLMIVDLLRHDLGRVCRFGSVEVPSLMAVEGFATVHQLVSTITGRLDRGRDALDLVHAAFPPGSMTGAPKERTLEILDALESSRRGPYGGALGWLSVDGAMELSVVIRTAVQVGGRLEVGVGGAITALSSPEAEWDEAMLKGAALGRALYAPETECFSDVSAQRFNTERPRPTSADEAS